MSKSKRIFIIVSGLIALCISSPRPAAAQSPKELEALRKDIEALKLGQMKLQEEIQEIKNILRGPREPVEVTLSVDDDPAKGRADATLTLIEFSDYQCPFCARFAHQTLPKIERDYIKTGKLRYVYRDFPIEAIHREAFKAAEAANCAGEQGKYWEMHDKLFANQKALAQKDLLQHAQALELEQEKFNKCLDDGSQTEEVRKDFQDGRSAGVGGTPTFFLGRTVKDDPKVKALVVIKGARPYPHFKQAFDRLLSSEE